MKTSGADPDDTSIRSSDDKLVPVKVYIPDLFIQKSFQFRKDELLWDVKQQIIDSLPKELQEHFNYGLFCPPVNGRAGKFLDEQRTLFEYPFPEPVGYLELRYKRRVYKVMNLDEKQIKQLHTRTNLRRMLDYISSGQHEKVTKMCARGMDPNFHCVDSGETPLTVAVSLKQPAKVIMALVNGGALLDFRTKDGFTAVHRAVQKNNLEALKILLDLGASPNYRDSRGLTPLYHSLLHASDPQLSEVLLHDHAVLGTCDHQGWQEVHQACKYGLVQHLEHLLFYGADINARNASGNTPLHICAVNDQENCARVLLFRGADKEALNFANQSAYQVAVIAGNHGLADLIKNHSDSNVVLFREAPRYNPCRRSSIAPPSHLIRACSDPRLESLGVGMSTFVMKPPSPCPSNASLPPLSSSASCMSEASTSSSSTCCTQTSGSEETASASVVAESAVSDSSGVCTSNSGASFEEQHLRELENGAADMLENQVSSLKRAMQPFIGLEKGNSKFVMQRIEGRRETKLQKTEPFISKCKIFGKPRTVILRKGKHGFGFVLRGAKATSPLMEREPSELWPSLQYLEDVDAGGVADQAGLKKGDFVLEINGQDVSQAPHEDVVSIIRLSGDIVMMTVVTVQPDADEKREITSQMRLCATLPRNIASKKAPLPPKRDPRTTLTVGRFRAQSMAAGLAEIEMLCGYDSEGHSTKSSSVESIADKQLQHAKSAKFASIRARPSSQKVSALELRHYFQHPQSTQSLPGGSWSSPKVYGSVAAMKRSKALKNKLTHFIGKIHKEFHSTPELRNSTSDISLEIKSHSQENFVSERSSCGLGRNRSYTETAGEMSYTEMRRYRESSGGISRRKNDVIYAQTLPLTTKSSHRISYPPPSHPPPPPPVGQIVEVNVTKTVSDYANVNVLNHDPKSTVMSSFRPGDSAKLYASPQNVVSIGYRQTGPTQVELSRQQGVAWDSNEKRSRSLPARISDDYARHKLGVSVIQDAKGDYSTFGRHSEKKQMSPLDLTHTLNRGPLKMLKPKHSSSSGYGSKFDGDDSDSSSIQNYNPFSSHTHEPFIPEPDYESSEEESCIAVDADSSEVQLSTFSRSEVPVSREKSPVIREKETEAQISESSAKLSPHTEAKRAIQQARERLRFSQRPPDKNTTVVFISGRIEKKAERSEIQLHRNEEGRLTGTVVISTVKETSQPSSYGTPSLTETGDDVSQEQRHDVPQSKCESVLTSSDVSSSKEEHSPVVHNQPEVASAETIEVIATASSENADECNTGEAREEECVDRPQSDNGHVPSDRSGSPSPSSPLSTSSLSETATKPAKNSEEGEKPVVSKSSSQHDLLEKQPGKTADCSDEICSAKAVYVKCQKGTSRSSPRTQHVSGKAASNSAQENVSKCEKAIQCKDETASVTEGIHDHGLCSSEVDELTQLVPPPPEFAGPRNDDDVKEAFEITLAPPPEFSDSYMSLPPRKLRNDDVFFRHGCQRRKHLRHSSFQTSYSCSNSNMRAERTWPQQMIHEHSNTFHVLKLPAMREQKAFRYKPLPQWTTQDIADWLDSLFLSEYKQYFVAAGITGAKLANMDSNDLMGLGVKQMGHRLNMERSVKRYLR